MLSPGVADSTTDAESRFRHLYEENLSVVAAYASRRARSGEDAADVVAETFLVAWRRLDKVPEGENARLWLLGVARRVLWNGERSARRQRRLGAKLAEEQAFHRVRLVVEDGNPHLAEALARLPAADRDLLGLVAWEGLNTEELAAVLGCSGNAAKIRVHRARKRLQSMLARPETNEEAP